MRFFAAFLVAACATESQAESPDGDRPAPIPVATAGQSVAVFAGGCFWCMEKDFDHLDGVIATTSGYAGGKIPNPTYAIVSGEQSGHQEVVRVVFDTGKLTYSALLTYYFHHIDPTDGGGQFCDRGDSYRPVIFAADAAQAKVATAAKADLDGRKVLPGPVVVPIVEGATFYAAEVFHQDYHTINPSRYLSYRTGCRRDARVREVWLGQPG